MDPLHEVPPQEVPAVAGPHVPLAPPLRPRDSFGSYSRYRRCCSTLRWSSFHSCRSSHQSKLLHSRSGFLLCIDLTRTVVPTGTPCYRLRNCSGRQLCWCRCHCSLFARRYRRFRRRTLQKRTVVPSCRQCRSCRSWQGLKSWFRSMCRKARRSRKCRYRPPPSSCIPPADSHPPRCSPRR